jgi:3-oxoacyl-[acyl-carrier protein] reductase
VALALAAEGAKVAIAARRTDRLDAIAKRAKELGAPDARGFSVDLADAVSVERLLEEVRASFGAPEILVLNGGGPKAGRFSDVDAADWDAAYRLVLRSMIELVEGARPSGAASSR